MVRKGTAMLRICSCFSFACEDCLRPGEPLPTHKPFISVFQPFESPSHAGAMDKYNSVEGLLAPAREGALRPLSGRYLLKLAAGQRSLMWSPLVFVIDTISILDTPSFPFFVVGSSVSCPQTRQEEGNSSGGKICRKRPFTFRRTTSWRRSAPASTSTFSLPCPTGGFPRVHGGVVESCVSTVDQPVFFSLLESCFLLAQGSSFLHFEFVVLTLSHDCLTNPQFFTGDRFSLWTFPAGILVQLNTA